jgi:hypothetical protein
MQRSSQRFLVILSLPLIPLLSRGQDMPSGVPPEARIQHVYNETAGGLRACQAFAVALDQGETAPSSNQTSSPGLTYKQFHALTQMVYRSTRELSPIDGSQCASAIRGAFRDAEVHDQLYRAPMSVLQTENGARIERACREQGHLCRERSTDLSRFACLFRIANRRTREYRPGFDNADCGQQLRSVAASVRRSQPQPGVGPVGPQQSPSSLRGGQ